MITWFPWNKAQTLVQDISDEEGHEALHMLPARQKQSTQISCVEAV